jgi:hypothetical protein
MAPAPVNPTNPDVVAADAAVGTAKKLGIKDGGHLVLVRPSKEWSVCALPPSATFDVVRTAAGARRRVRPDSVVLAFFRSAAEYEADLPALARLIFPGASLWAAWPRRAGGHVSDLTDNTIRDFALRLGLVDNKVAAIDADWSGLRLVWRQELRGTELPATLMGYP